MDYVLDVCKLAARIEGNIKKDIDYSELEETVGYSYHHIRDFFKQITNVSLSRYILARKIANAAFEIRHSEKSVTEIALEYEFANADTFARAFRRSTGLTPSQFKQSAYLCGRRIICPGVYAPVILAHDNPAGSMFTLQHIKEVNEMGEMKKTEDSCLLYGVPKVYFGREENGETQNLPFPMCLQAVLNYMGQNISYTEIMAYSGAAFRQRWDRNGWNIAAIDIRFTYAQHLAPFELAFKGTGRKFTISEKHMKSIDKNDAMALIKSEIDCGRPVIALGVVGPPETSIVTGYRNNGETLLGWSLFQDFWGGCTFDESGYFVKDNWWDTTETVMSIGEEIVSPTTDSDVLENALMLMTTGEIATYDGSDIFYGGQNAYEAWALALEDEYFPNHVDDEQKDQEKMLAERGYGAAYMQMMAEKYPDKAAVFKECAHLLKAAADYAPQITKLRKKHGLSPIEIREKMAVLIRKAAKCEKEACVLLAQILGRTPSQMTEIEKSLMHPHDDDSEKAAMPPQKRAFLEYLKEKKKNLHYTNTCKWFYDQFTEISAQAPDSSEQIYNFLERVSFHSTGIRKNSHMFVTDYIAFIENEQPQTADELRIEYERTLLHYALAAVQASKQRIVPIPKDTKINPEVLCGLTNDDFVTAFETLQEFVTACYDDILHNHEAWSYFPKNKGYNFSTNIGLEEMHLWGTLFKFSRHGRIGDNNVLIVDRSAFAVNKETTQLFDGFTNMGLVIDGFDKHSKEFYVTYPDNPNVLTILCNAYFTSKGCTKCGEDCFNDGNCYWGLWDPTTRNIFSYRFVEDPAAQQYDYPFLAMTDGEPEQIREIQYWLYAQAKKYGFRNECVSLGCIVYMKGSPMSTSPKIFPLVGMLKCNRGGYTFAAKTKFQRVFETHPKKIVALAKRFPSAFGNPAYNCPTRCGSSPDKMCKNNYTYEMGGIIYRTCRHSNFEFPNPTLDDVKLIFELWQLENKVKPVK